MNKILVTGTTKGLGKYISDNLESDSFNREDKIEKFHQKTYDVIIHCAFERAGRKVTNENLYEYLNSSIHLTKQIINIPHKQFFYCSTVDVYPNIEEKIWKEEDPITLDDFHNLYGFIKLCCESIVLEEANNPVVMRLGAMLGKDIQPNSLMKIYQNITNKIGLSKESTFNYILHKDVLSFIENAVENNLSGCFNLTSSDKTTIGQSAQEIDNTIEWGNFSYQTANISNEKICASSPQFNKTSLENVRIFFDELNQN